MSSLVDRLRDLAQVELDALLVGEVGDSRRRLLSTHLADLEDALAEAREQMNALVAGLRGPSDPLALIDWEPDRRTSEEAETLARGAADLLDQRARVARDLAVLAQATARVLPRLIAAGRRL